MVESSAIVAKISARGYRVKFNKKEFLDVNLF